MEGDWSELLAVASAEAIISNESAAMAAEITKSHAEMILLASVMDKHLIVAGFVTKAIRESIEYTTGLLVAVGLTARNWGRLLAERPGYDFAGAIALEAEAFCEQDFAHYLTKEILGIEETPQVDGIRAQMMDHFEEKGLSEFAKTCVHTVGLCSELIQHVLEIRNGEE